MLLNLNANESKSLGEVLKEAIFPEDVDFLGIGVNPSFYTCLIVTGLLLLFALIVRIFVIPRFKIVPGKFQSLLEKLVEFFSNMAHENSPHRDGFLGCYIFTAGVFIFSSTMIELFGFRSVLVDLNACLVMGVMSFSVILLGGARVNKVKGVMGALKDFSLPISMTFRLFGSMLSGLLVIELVYQFVYLSVGLPVFIYLMFTVLHAIVQTYILTLLTSIFYGESTEPHIKKKKIGENDFLVSKS